VTTEASPDEVEPTASAEPALRGSVLDVLRTLLGGHQERDAVLSIVGQLVARNTDLERRVARMAGGEAINLSVALKRPDRSLGQSLIRVPRVLPMDPRACTFRLSACGHVRARERPCADPWWPATQ
jgi:hypothetical protein